MDSLYFRIVEPPAPAVFNAGWTELRPTLKPFVLGRDLWRGRQVSRNDDLCAVIRYDLQSELWVLKNRSRDLIVMLNNGDTSFPVKSLMSVDFDGTGPWWGSLIDVFRFEVVRQRPRGPIVIHGEAPPAEVPDGATTPRRAVVLAQDFLAKYPHKRRALAFLWRQYLEPTRDLPRELRAADVGTVFREKAAAITTWREELAKAVYGERGHQNRIRDLVIGHGALTRADVQDADRWLRDNGYLDG